VLLDAVALEAAATAASAAAQGAGGVHYFGLIEVPASSELVLADEDLNLHAAGIRVLGRLRAGSATCRCRSAVTITLHGARPSGLSSSHTYHKGIVAEDGGAVELFGALFDATWSRLAATARAGEQVLFLQDAVNWEAGQRVVVTTTHRRDGRDWHQNEERAVAAVKAVSHLLPASAGPVAALTAVYLDTPLLYEHHGGSEFQAEVGLLSRRVVVRGSGDDSEPTDAEPVACHDDTFGSFPCADSWLTG